MSIRELVASAIDWSELRESIVSIVADSIDYDELAAVLLKDVDIDEIVLEAILEEDFPF